MSMVGQSEALGAAARVIFGNSSRADIQASLKPGHRMRQSILGVSEAVLGDTDEVSSV
jgi:hypothetical protein